MDAVLPSTLFDERGSQLSFETLLNSQDARVQRTLVVFIRHFFCGNCQEYVRRLATDLSPSTSPEDLSILIIGCGASSLISSYRNTTHCPFPIYADPTTRIHKRLGMRRSLSLGPRDPAYIHHSLASGMMKSVVQGLKRIPTGDVSKGGDLSVNGGEFLFVRNAATADWDIKWSHCMMNSRDHTEIDVLKAQLHFGTTVTSMDLYQPEVERNSSTATTLSSCSTVSDHDSDQGCPVSTKEPVSPRRRNWMVRAGHSNRPSSFRGSIIHVS